MRYRFSLSLCRFILYIICLQSYVCWSQQKDALKILTPREYDKWYRVENRGMSQEGTWLSYSVNYSVSDSLIIQQTYGNKKYVIAKASGMEFLGDSLASFNQNGLGYLMSLNTGRRQAFSSGTEFRISNNEQYLMVFEQTSARLMLKSLQDKDSLVLIGVSEYIYNPVLEGVCACSAGNGRGKIEIIRLAKGFPGKNIPVPQNREILELKWHHKGNFLAFTMGIVQDSHDTTDVGLVGYYDINKERSFYLNPTEIEDFSQGHILISNRRYPLDFSPDGKQVLFAHKPEIILPMAKNPEIWKWDDYFVKQSITAWSNNIPKISMWDPINNRHLQITDQNFPEAYYSLNNGYALVYNPAKYRLYHKYDAFDIYLLNLESGERRLLISQFLDSAGSLSVSPSGRYVMYLKDELWWCHDTQKNVLINLTQKLETVSGYKTGPLESSPEGWTQDEKAVYMHDSFDLWRITMDDKLSERITSGRVNGVRFELINNISKTQTDLRNNRGVYLDDSIFFFVVRKGDKMGYAYKKVNCGIIYINIDECYIRWPKIALKIALNNKVISFTKENYNIPPRLFVYDLDSDTLFQAFQSNPHYINYPWYERKNVTYRNKNGKQLTGILYYPMDYQQDSLYPMVVHVYEKQSHYWQQYVNPSFDNPIGFNPANLTADGYFVFLPDIEYEIGEPGFSAADCIISGTKAAMENAPVNPEKIGLIGQSFGGYETMFTITQTDLFATAIAGAGVSNLPSDYLNIEGTQLRFFQYEDSQLRMRRSLYEDYQGYLDNSPQYHAQKINIPVLLYTGGKDYHVNYTQTMAFHFAMTRLGKENTMLIYPDEAHAFNNPVNKKDLTVKVHEWFGHYLKGEPKRDWMP